MLTIKTGTERTLSLADQTKYEAAFDRVLSHPMGGFSRLYKNSQLFTDCIQHSKNIKENTLCIVGIGGSSVGTESLYRICKSQNSKKLVFLSNTDPLDSYYEIQKLDLNDTHWYIVSKSGNSLETLAVTDLVAQVYRDQNINFYDKVTVCTEDKKNPLLNWAQNHDIKNLVLPFDVGGRFSIFTPVGLLPLSFIGFDLKAIQKALHIDEYEKQNILNFSKIIFNSWQKSEILTYFWLYSSRMKFIGPWIEQLWAESLEKKQTRKTKPVNLQVSTPIAAVGANDQHSLLQQIVEGPKNKHVLFYTFHDLTFLPGQILKTEFENTEYYVGKSLGEILYAEALGTMQSLLENNISYSHIQIDSHEISEVVKFMNFLMHSVGVLGELLDIDAFNQPGVELGKQITKKILKGENST